MKGLSRAFFVSLALVGLVLFPIPAHAASQSSGGTTTITICLPPPPPYPPLPLQCYTFVINTSIPPWVG
jgi:hypothetical protein